VSASPATSRDAGQGPSGRGAATPRSTSQLQARFGSRPRLRLRPHEAAASLQLSEEQLVRLLARGVLRDVGTSWRRALDPAEVVARAEEWVAARRLSPLAALTARYIAEGRVDPPRPVTKTAHPPAPLELIETARVMHAGDLGYLHKDCA
jgi:hypothetical protein